MEISEDTVYYKGTLGQGSVCSKPTLPTEQGTSYLDESLAEMGDGTEAALSGKPEDLLAAFEDEQGNQNAVKMVAKAVCLNENDMPFFVAKKFTMKRATITPTLDVATVPAKEDLDQRKIIKVKLNGSATIELTPSITGADGNES